MSDKSKKETAIHQTTKLQVTETIKNEKATCALEENACTPILVDSHYQIGNNQKKASGS